MPKDHPFPPRSLWEYCFIILGVCVCACTHTQSCLTLCDPMDCQAPLSMEFSRQEYWSGCYFLLQGIILTQGLNLYLLHLLHWHVDYLPPCHLGSPIHISSTYPYLTAYYSRNTFRNNEEYTKINMV